MGVYFIVNKQTSQPKKNKFFFDVGSTILLSSRIKDYRNASLPTSTDSRPVEVQLRTYGLAIFTFIFMEFPLVNYLNADGSFNKPQAQRDVLSVEQYFILTLKPVLNFMRVVNYAPCTGKPVFLYQDDVLVYEADSSVEASHDLNITVHSLYRCRKANSKLLGLFTVSLTGPESNTVSKIIPLVELRSIINEVKAKRGILERKSVVLTNILTNESFTFNSISEAARNIGVSQPFLGRTIKSGRPSLGK